MVRVRSIVLIAMLAMARKFIILGLKKAASANLLALAAAILALRVIFWLMHEKGCVNRAPPKPTVVLNARKSASSSENASLDAG